MNNKKTQQKKEDIYKEDIYKEDIYKEDFINLMNDLRQIGKQIIMIRIKVDELKKDRLFIKKRCKL